MNEFYMNKALELAEKGGLYVKPNPLVGAVIVKNNQIIGEGYQKIAFRKFNTNEIVPVPG
jgi:diaminohydroxyphosphoribosylaminopyrimidine deaminase/5-amino-6-(5-phosphoribosylamino)uracil reductase